jgi:RNA polymerase sigma-70 factor (ECF subfamily)
MGDTELAGIPSASVAPLDAQLMAQRIRREIKSLSPEQCRCLELKIEGYSYEETSARTGFSVEAVKSYIQNGRRMLWRKMEGALSQPK